MVSNLPDLKFIPVDNTAPRVLSHDDIEHYNTMGYVSPLDLFSPDEADLNRNYFEDLLAQIPDSGAYSINCYQARCEGIWDICTEPRILDYVEDIVGPNIVCWASHFFCKNPHDPKTVPWHQDATYWKLSPARTVTVWLAIDDADVENSAMRFIPQSHNKGHLKYDKAGGDSVLRFATTGADNLGEPFSNRLNSGQISLHADMLVHGSLPNSSNRRRCGLTLRYCPPEVCFLDDTWAASVEAIVCRGHDPYKRWKHHPRPVGNNVSPQNSPHNIGGN